MKTIREYCKEVGWEIVGKLTRRNDLEYETNYWGEKGHHSGIKTYTDEAGNEYEINKNGVCIVTVDGAVI